MHPKKGKCAICLGSMKTGRGQAIFTAECSHSFHFSCIASSVKHGNRICPICRSTWNDLPFDVPAHDLQHGPVQLAPRVSIPVYNSSPLPSPVAPPWFPPEPQTFSDDERIAPVENLSNAVATLSVSRPDIVTVNALPEYPAVDLVAVLDVSGSMSGTKIELLKRSVCFIVDNLGPTDRLSIVTFSEPARRIYPLRRMTDEGRDSAKAAVCSLAARGGTNTLLGLRKGIRVLEECREKNPMSSIILLSDGRDNHASSSQRLSPSMYFRNQDGTKEGHNFIAVHAFGIGTDHDSTFLHGISDASGGTFSFIETVEAMQDAFARCVGGLLSVVAQQLHIRVKPAFDGVHIERISSGRYPCKISENSKAVISVGDLYPDENKELLVYISVPAASTKPGAKVTKMSLLDVMCRFQKPVTTEKVNIEAVRVKIDRPPVLNSADKKVSLEVDRQKIRFQVAEVIAQAKELAEKRNLTGAQALLSKTRSAIASTPSAQSGDPLCTHLDDELKEIQERMASREQYEHTGRAYSQDRAKKLLAELAVEEQRGIELTRILKQIITEPKTPNLKKSHVGRKYLREDLARIDESWAAARFDSLPHVVQIVSSKDREGEVQALKEQSDIIEEVPKLSMKLCMLIMILRLFSESAESIGVLKTDLAEAKKRLGTRNKQLHQLWSRSVTLRHIISLLDQIEGIAKVPARIEKLIAESQFYAAVQLHVQSALMLEREGLQMRLSVTRLCGGVANSDSGSSCYACALQDVRSELTKLRGTLFYKVLEDLHAHLYNKGDYSSSDGFDESFSQGDEVAVNGYASSVRTNGGDSGKTGTRALSHQVSHWLSAATPDEFLEAVKKSDAALHVKYLHTMVECLCKLGKVAAAGAMICQRFETYHS
ncbi:hypothetical protein Droror1_Dr00014714 [Drosera rotundifolia]